MFEVALVAARVRRFEVLTLCESMTPARRLEEAGAMMVNEDDSGFHRRLGRVLWRPRRSSWSQPCLGEKPAQCGDIVDAHVFVMRPRKDGTRRSDPKFKFPVGALDDVSQPPDERDHIGPLQIMWKRMAKDLIQDPVFLRAHTY